MVQPVRKAVFPVAGLGTRFLPATKVLPKEMLPIVDKPLIQYALEEAMEPYKEQKRELKAEYVEEGWLTKQDISLAVKAYRLAKSETDMSELIDMVQSLRDKGLGQ